MKTWRMVFSGANDGFFNMALDEALLLSCLKGVSPPVLRLCQWNPPAVSLGYFQPANKAVDARKCRHGGIDLVRRITGGRAVLHRDEVTYSVCASTSDSPELGENVGETYRRLSMALLESLRVLGIEGKWVKPSSAEAKPVPASTAWSTPCFLSCSRYELTVQGKKLIGSAQRRFSLCSALQARRGFIQHGSIPLGKGSSDLAELLPDVGSTLQLKRDLSQRSTHLQALLGRRVSPEEMASVLKKGFEKFFDCRMEQSSASEKELRTARALSREKYSTSEWNLRR